MKLLILGGTGFLGRHIVEAALSRGHHLTLFNRGRRNSSLFPDVERLIGNRDGDLKALKGRRWEAVIDTCGYIPRIVRDSARLLAPYVEHYTFISSISVYSDLSRPGVDESGELATLKDPTVEDITAETYGPLKVLCERAVEDELPGRALQIRPGLIVGPHDPTDRFTYWPHRIAQGGEVLIPAPRDLLTQFIDARDLALWTVMMVERTAVGAYNAVGPVTPLAMESLAESCRAAANSDAQFTWIDGPWLRDRGIDPQSFLFWWIGNDDPANRAAFQVSCAKAIAAGLTFRSTEKIVKSVLEWDRARPADREMKYGLSPNQERELLREWLKSHKA